MSKTVVHITGDAAVPVRVVDTDHRVRVQEKAVQPLPSMSMQPSSMDNDDVMKQLQEELNTMERQMQHTGFDHPDMIGSADLFGLSHDDGDIWGASHQQAMAAPVIRETKKGQKVMTITMDVGDFTPNEIQVSTEGNLLRVTARRVNVKKERTADTKMMQEASQVFRREFTLPDVVRADTLKCELTPEGDLMIEGPLGKDKSKKKRKVTFAL